MLCNGSININTFGSIKAVEKRICFSKGMQNKFILDLKERVKLNWEELAQKLKLNSSTLNKSYLYEKCNLPYDLFRKILQIIQENEKEILTKYNAYLKKEEIFIGRKVLGEQRINLENINIDFKKTDINLDCSNINYSKYDLLKKINFPNKITEDLAEEIGMHLGDGFLSSLRYDYRLKGNPLDEKDYYNKYIKPLFKRLYNLDINLKNYSQSYGFELTSKALWEFKSKVLGIKTGEKNTITLPEVLKVNNPKILCAFIRGLFDTDGCLYFRSNYGYKGYYPTITLGLASKQLVKEVGEILIMLGFKPGIYFYKEYATVRLNGIKSFKRYQELIGWSSQKNLNRVQNWNEKWKQLNMAVVV